MEITCKSYASCSASNLWFPSVPLGGFYNRDFASNGCFEIIYYAYFNIHGGHNGKQEAMKNVSILNDK
jgi:hypothetical protein